MQIVDIYGLQNQRAEYKINSMHFRGRMYMFIVGGMVFLYFSGTERCVDGRWVKAYDSWNPFVFNRENYSIETQNGIPVLVTPKLAFHVIPSASGKI